MTNIKRGESMKDYINFNIERIESNLKELKDARTADAAGALCNEIIFYTNEIKERLKKC